MKGLQNKRDQNSILEDSRAGWPWSTVGLGRRQRPAVPDQERRSHWGLTSAARASPEGARSCLLLAPSTMSHRCEQQRSQLGLQRPGECALNN